MPIVMAHKYFDRFQAAFALKTQSLTHLLLLLEGQLILMLAGGKMQLVADSQQKIVGGLQFRDIRRTDDPLGSQLIEILDLHLTRAIQRAVWMSRKPPSLSLTSGSKR